MNSAQQKLAQKLTSRLMFAVFKFLRLPSLFFWRVRITKLDSEECRVTIPMSWRTQNPFKSIYFSALAGAAELSTGALVLLHIEGKGRWSMLVTRFESDFVKKAKSKCTWTCGDGLRIAQAVKKVETTGEPQSFVCRTQGIDDEGNVYAKAEIHWSIAKK